MFDGALRLLLVEDDDHIAVPLAEGLGRHGYTVNCVTTGREGFTESEKADLILLDLNLPDLDGYEVCRRIREQSDVPIIAVTARAEEIDRVMGLQIGADDYVVKPFAFRELVARIQAVTRRTHPRSREADQVPHPRGSAENGGGTVSGAGTATGNGNGGEVSAVGPLRVDSRTHRATLKAREIRLSPKEFDLLALLCSDPGRVFTREEIMDQVWDENWFGPTRTLDVHVNALRTKLGDPAWVQTVRGVGFRVNVPAQR
jgi:DNA-binding response OmpR family regulator